MIFECPKCRTTHSKPEREIRVGTVATCRRCAHEIKLEPSAQPTTPQAARDAKKPAATPFHTAPTAVNIPMGVEQPGASNVTGATKTSDAKVASPAGGSVPAPRVPPPGSAGTPGTFRPSFPGKDPFAVSSEKEATTPDGGPTHEDTQAEMREMLRGTKPASSGLIDDRVGEASVDLSVPESLADMEKTPTPVADLSGVTPIDRSTEGRAVRLPPFPLGPLRAWAAGVWQFYWAQHVGLRIGVAVVLTAILIVPILLLALSDDSYRVAYVDEDQVLMAGPGSHDTYTEVAGVERGEEVLVFDAGSFGEYTMVRDMMGRAGFLPSASVSDYRPYARAGVPFVGCRQAPIESDMDACRERAHVQFETCRELCEDDGEEDEDTCLDHCQIQLRDCIRGCEGVGLATPTPSLDGPAKPKLAKPRARSKPRPKPVPKKPKRPKRKRKRKR